MDKWNSCGQLKIVNIDVMHNGTNNIKIPRYKVIITPTLELQGNNDWHTCKGTAIAVFVEFNLLWHIIKIDIHTAINHKFYYFCHYISHVSVILTILTHLNTLL